MDASASIPASAAASGIATAAPPATAPTRDPAAARKTAENFAGFYLSQVFDTMFSSLGSDALFGAGNGETVYRSLLIQEYSKVASRSGSGMGIADAVQREILQAQEAR
jgi:peptidoglycan hydrolase FlgJ